MSRNTNLSKEIATSRRKNEDTKDLIENTERSIFKLMNKKKDKNVEN